MPTDDETPFPSLGETVTGFSAFGRSHLSPDDAFVSPTRRRYGIDTDGANGERSRSRRRKRAWKKLMWVKQSFPDNYTDQETFLENLQRNPRLKPYDFWPLVFDSTVILQHVCSVILFTVCFVGIFQERVSPVSVVSWSSFLTFVGWLLWERWVAEEDQEEDAAANSNSTTAVIGRNGSIRRTRGRAGSVRRPLPPMRSDMLLSVNSANSLAPSTATSAASSTSNLHTGIANSHRSASTTSLTSHGGTSHTHLPRLSQDTIPETPALLPDEESRTYQRLGTIKSAILIYCTLLGLSPILKSLTRSTSSDSIWAISFWLLAINVFFFDYSGGVGVKFPATLSTNAALMASTVLASRLPSTKQVFSLTLFSIEVFGLFPVFRRHVRHRSAKYYALLTVVLVLSAGLGVGLIVAESPTGKWPWKRGIGGMVISVFVAAFAAGGCSWWLIGLQKYKNEIRGPWDPARPIIMSRTRWSDR